MQATGDAGVAEKRTRSGNAELPHPGHRSFMTWGSRGMNIRSSNMALLTLARKISSVALRLWKKGELWDPAKLTTQAT